MREIFEEYGKVVIAAVSSIALIGFAASFLTSGQAFQAIIGFSQQIC